MRLTTAGYTYGGENGRILRLKCLFLRENEWSVNVDAVLTPPEPY